MKESELEFGGCSELSGIFWFKVRLRKNEIWHLAFCMGRTSHFVYVGGRLMAIIYFGPYVEVIIRK
jgi:hypothetical protein